MDGIFMQEMWKEIRGYEGIYVVSSYGRVRNIQTNYLKIPQKSPNSYPQLLLSIKCMIYTDWSQCIL
jgi:hypothetical protein